MNTDKLNKFYQLAVFQADLFSKDPSKKVCALFIAPETYQILSAGYNGMPRGIDEKIESRWERPIKYKYVVHAETNGIYNSSLNGVSLKNSICIVTMFPCSNCAKALIQVGVKKVITQEPNLEHERWGEDFKYSLELLKEVNMDIFYV
jgi:dCMP deaminase